jgi:uncharacterized protein
MSEFLSYRLNAPIEDIPNLLVTSPADEQRLLIEYLQFGGYPRVINEETNVEKYAVMADIFQAYIERDIRVLLQIEKSRSLVTLLQLLAHRIGRLINYQDLANLTNLSASTLKNYLWYCQKTFVIEEVLPYFTNKEKELVKSPQYYFVDPGLQHFLTNQRQIAPTSPDWGFLFQQMIYHLLKNRFNDGFTSIHYWRTQNQAEVDFVINNGSSLLPIEVKATALNQPQVERSLHSFIERYNPSEAWVMNRSLHADIQIKQTKVRFLPWHALLINT